MFGQSLEFLMIVVLFADCLVSRGGQLWTWVKGEVAVVEADVKKL